MSEEQQFETIIQEIIDIYIFLTQGEPTPDDEIEARTSLIELIKQLKNIDSHQGGSNSGLFEEVLTSLENWDTLELWFTESEIPDHIKKIINLTDEIHQAEVIREIEESPTKETGKPIQPQIDINEIIDQVSDKFKDEIDGLKQKIDFLQHEIDEKEEKLKYTTDKKIVKITPKKNVKLPPPKIKIPTIKKPETPPQIRVAGKTEPDKPKEKIALKSIEEVQVLIEEELEKLSQSPSSPLTPPPQPPPSQQTSSTPKTISTDEALDEEKVDGVKVKELKPIPVRPASTIIEDTPKESSSILDILDEQESEYKDEEPINIEEITPVPKKPRISTEVSIAEEEPKVQKKSAPFILQDLAEQEKPKPFLPQTPKISSVSVEEIETESIKSAGTELFNVFSSVGSKPVEKSSVPKEILSADSDIEKKKKDSKKKMQDSNTMTFVGFNSVSSQTSTAEEYSSDIEELPKDKDSLYQELIALEGKRYSLEKTFKELERSYNDGSIADVEFKNRSVELRKQQDDITSRINSIRRVIASL